MDEKRKWYFDVSTPLVTNSDDILKKELQKYGQDISPCIRPDNQIEFRYIPDKSRNIG